MNAKDDPDDLQKLGEYTKDEWRSVAKLIRPDWTEEQFESAWNEFQLAKKQHGMNS